MLSHLLVGGGEPYELCSPQERIEGAHIEKNISVMGVENFLKTFKSKENLKKVKK
ncbi:hypothetical protein JGUZn3_10200 [Entomobacter blattae]|uniref:Uncharacterized protein n=1 Tax=Entomobacter blattae TaxID=2762277 RepID=A0A7H1NR38_9PROT|nr:hypothetical protein JGUZn3_10200 [Entomobacter blattae]